VVALLLLTFAFELAGGIDLILNPHSTGAAELIGNLLVGLLISESRGHGSAGGATLQ
jgi:hypothetical protein